jgi:hypothetical protein
MKIGVDARNKPSSALCRHNRPNIGLWITIGYVDLSKPPRRSDW